LGHDLVISWLYCLCFIQFKLIFLQETVCFVQEQELADEKILSVRVLLQLFCRMGQ